MKNFMCTKMKIFLLILFVLTISCYTLAAVNLYNSNYSISSYFSDITNWHKIHNWNFGWSNHENHLSGNIEKDFPNDIQTLNITTTSSNISLSPHEGSTIDINIHGSFTSNYNYSDCIKKFDISNSNVNIETSTETFFDDTSLDIAIPNNFIGNINIKSVSGDISISSLTLSNLSLSTTSGDIEAYNINSTNSNITTISGEFNYTGSLGECNISSTSGDIKLNLSDLGNSSTITSTSGNIDVSLASTLGYKANLSSTSGDIEARNHNTDDLNINKNYTLTNGDGSKNISIHTTSGDISIY